MNVTRSRLGRSSASKGAAAESDGEPALCAKGISTSVDVVVPQHSASVASTATGLPTRISAQLNSPQPRQSAVSSTRSAHGFWSSHEHDSPRRPHLRRGSGRQRPRSGHAPLPVRPRPVRGHVA